ncbi:MAG: hypothetical protein Q8L39_12055 [Burkholderiales bacterium]|nr:hypothetical protein [Burkholderiales bacterium]
MKAVQKIAKRLKDSTINPESAIIFRDLIQALHAQREFQLTRFYNLNYEDFDLALSLLIEWRLQRFTMAKGGLMGLLQEASNTNKSASIFHA